MGSRDDLLLGTDPLDDAGAETADRYRYQHHCALRLLLTAVAEDLPLTLAFETHEDILVLDAGGRVERAISVKHRDDERPWTRAALLREGGLRRLFETWRNANGQIEVALMTNAALASGRGGARDLARGWLRRDDATVTHLAANLRCEPGEAAAFLAALAIEGGLPHRHDIRHVQLVRFLEPALRRLDLSDENREALYTAVLELVADRSTDRSPLDEDVRLALLRGPERDLAEREARLRSRLVSAAEVADRLRRSAVPGRRPPEGRPVARQVHAVPLPDTLIARSAELEEIDRRIAEGNARVLAITAFGGEGKSTVAKQFADRSVGRRFDRMFSFSLAVDPPERFLTTACEFFFPGDATLAGAPPFTQARRVADALADQACLLVLHEFERALERRPGHPRHGRLHSRELRELLELHLSTVANRSVVMLTTRNVPRDLVGAAGYDEYELPRVSVEDAVIYLRRRGVRGSQDQLEEVAERYFTHPLSLRALADYLLRSRWQGDVAGAPAKLPESRDRGLGAILGDYYGLLSALERKVVSAIAASLGKLPYEGLRFVVSKSGLDVDEGELEEAVQVLSESVLVHFDASEGDEVVLTTHPLIAEHLIEVGPPEEVAAIRRHIAAFQLARLPSGRATSLEESEPGIVAFMQYVELGELSAAHRLYVQRLPVSEHLFWAGHYRVCASLTSPLIAALGDPSFPVSGDEAAALYLDAGRVAAKVATVDRAIEEFETAARRATPGSPAHSRAVLYGIEVALEGGRCLDASGRMGQALRRGWLDRSSFRVIGRQGYVHACLGNDDRAESLLTDAIEKCRAADAMDDGYPAGYLCLFLRIRADLAVRSNRPVDADRDVDEALEIARGPHSFRDYEGHLLRTRGDACLAAGACEAARGYYEAALEIARDSGYRWLEAEVLVGLGRCSFAEGEREAADEHARAAMAIAAGGGWWLEEGRAHVLRGEVALVEGLSDVAASVATARSIAKRSGHRLLRSELRTLEQDWLEGR